MRRSKLRPKLAFILVALAASAGCNAILGNGYGVDDTVPGSGGEGGNEGDALVEGDGGDGDGGMGGDGMARVDSSVKDAGNPDSACPRGACPTLLAPVVGPQRLALGTANVYWAALGEIGRADLDGSNQKRFTIAQAVPANLKRGVAVVPGGGAAYVTMPGGGKGYARCTADLADCTPAFIGSAGQSSDVALDATHVHLGTFDDGTGSGKGGIWRTNLDGSGLFLYSMMLDKVLDLRVVGGATFFRTATAVNFNTPTTAPVAVADLGGQTPLAFGVSGADLVIATTNNELHTCKTTTLPCTAPNMGHTTSPAAAVTVDTARIYWVERTSGSVRRCDVADCFNTDVVLANGQASPNDLVVDTTSVYWANFGDDAGVGGAVMKVEK